MSKPAGSSAPAQIPLRITLLGDEGAGKLALLTRFIYDRWEGVYDPTIQDTQQKLIHLDGEPVLLEVTSFATQDGWITFPRTLARASDGLMLVYSVKAPKALERLVWWDEQIRAFKDGELQQELDEEERVRKRRVDLPVVVLVGNQCDAGPGWRVASREAGQKAAGALEGDGLGCTFHETSAKDGTGVDDVFHDIARQILARRKPQQQPERPVSVKVKPPLLRRTTCGTCVVA